MDDNKLTPPSCPFERLLPKLEPTRQYNTHLPLNLLTYRKTRTPCYRHNLRSIPQRSPRLGTRSGGRNRVSTLTFRFLLYQIFTPPFYRNDRDSSYDNDFTERFKSVVDTDALLAHIEFYLNKVQFYLHTLNTVFTHNPI